MTRQTSTPVTRAILVLRGAGVDFESFSFPYQEKGGTRASSAALGVSEHAIVKTLVMEDERGRPLLVLQHGDRTVSTKALARALGCKQIVPCSPLVAERHTGYRVGGTSPFGTVKPLPVHVESSILDLPQIYINGGSRGFLVRLDPWVLVDLLEANPVDVALTRQVTGVE